VTEVLDNPRAVVLGQPLDELPQDLYIPPDALEVFLEAFEGPLDLLLYLIKRNNIDILDIPVAEITHQYIEYVRLMTALRLELAAEYLVMAAWLGEFKSRMLLPRRDEEAEDEDPRAELVRRLQEYERYKLAAERLDVLPRVGRDVYLVQAHAHCDQNRPPPQIELRELLFSLQAVLARAALLSHHQVQREALSVRQRMTELLGRLSADRFTPFPDLFSPAEGRQGVVVTFLALLELLRASLIELLQAAPFAVIHVRACAA
jgi:segregation and condensation protein A